MLVVKIELWPRGLESRAKELVRVYIANDGTGTETHGNYDVAVMRAKETRPPWAIGYGGNETAKPVRTGRVEMHARSYPVLRLIARAIASLYPEWRN